MTTKPNIFKRFYETVKPEVLRFPGVVISTILAAVFHSINIFSLFDADSVEFTLFKASVMAGAFCIFIVLALEYFLSDKLEEKKFRLISYVLQGAGIVICLCALYPFFKNNSDCFLMHYICVFFAMLVMCPFFLAKCQKFEDTFPNLILSNLIAVCVSICVVTGLCIIIFAFNSLIYNIDDEDIYTCIVASAAIILYPNFFIAYAVKKDGDFEIPKVFKIIVKSILFSLYVILIAVLYAYLIKSLIKWTFPDGQINWFVSFATVFYLLFYISLKKYQDDKIISFFYKHGYLVLIPLIVIQCIAFGIRVSSYGFTSARYASLLYIIFSIAVVVLGFVKSGIWMKFVYPVFAAFLLFGGLTPFNVIDVPFRNQVARIEKIYKAHGMYKDGKLVTENADTVFSDEEKSQIMGSWDYIKYYDNLPLWNDAGVPAVETDEMRFGFTYQADDDNQDYVYGYYVDSKNYVIDVSDYSTLKKLESKMTDDGKYIIVSCIDGTEYDLTEFIEQRLKKGIKLSDYDENHDKPLVIDLPDGKKALVYDLSVVKYEKASSPHFRIEGFLAE